MSLRPQTTCGKCTVAAPCTDRLTAVLASGSLAPSPPISGTVFTITPDFQQCAICLGPMAEATSSDSPIIALECQHIFHIDCMAAVVDRDGVDSRCPICRTKVAAVDLTQINTHRLKEQVIQDKKVVSRSRNMYVMWASYPGAKGVYDDSGQHLIRMEYPDGQVQHYTVVDGQTRLNYSTYRDGQRSFYGDNEKLERVEFPGLEGRVVYYDGTPGQEIRVRATHADGHEDFYGGNGQLVRVVYPDGRMAIYEGPKGAERPVRIEMRMETGGGQASTPRIFRIV